ncbi:MAG: serine O-acetyltransferase [Cardiobacteriaceae bacterium]|nr:serine O-acetyltransferase [Cardiobacteriaceae bacterium]
MGLWTIIREDFETVKQRDPATQSALAVWLLHTGFWAVVHYRIQHFLWSHGFRGLSRWLSVISRWLTGVEIHPAMRAGRRLFIDHGMGIVIGETAELGDDVSIYQGVTLGGTSWQQGKRHPTIGNNVILGAGAKVIGAIKVGDGARVGSNAVVVKEVAAGATVVGIPARAVGKQAPHDEAKRFESYAQGSDTPDPVRELLEQMNNRIHALEEELKQLKGKA